MQPLNNDPAAMLAQLQKQGGGALPGGMPNPMEIMKSITALGEAAANIETVVEILQRMEARQVEIHAVTTQLEPHLPLLSKLAENSLVTALAR